MNITYINARKADNGWDTDDCPEHETLKGAVIELVSRCVELGDIAPYLFTLSVHRCGMGSEPTYHPVSSGLVARVCVEPLIMMTDAAKGVAE